MSLQHLSNETYDVDLFQVAFFDEFVERKHIIPPSPPILSEVYGATVGALVAMLIPIAFVNFITLLGFGSSGIVAGSFGSWFMSLYGGTVRARSISAAGAIFGVQIAKHFENEDNKLTETKLVLLNEFLEIERNNLINGLSITINQKLLTNKEFIDTFLQVFSICIIFTRSKNYQFLIDNKDYEYFLGRYLSVMLIIGYDQSRITKFQNEEKIGFNIDLSTHEFILSETNNETGDWDMLEALIEEHNKPNNLSPFGLSNFTENDTDETMESNTDETMGNNADKLAENNNEAIYEELGLLVLGFLIGYYSYALEMFTEGYKLKAIKF
ncbi:19773_t:CDS:2, partial [Dentiscutata erythropus]